MWEFWWGSAAVIKFLRKFLNQITEELLLRGLKSSYTSLFYFTTQQCCVKDIIIILNLRKEKMWNWERWAQVLYKKVFSLQMSVLATCWGSDCVPVCVQRKKQRWNIKVDSTLLVGRWLSFHLKIQKMGLRVSPAPTSFHFGELLDGSRLWLLAQALMHCPTKQSSVRTREEMHHHLHLSLASLSI